MALPGRSAIVVIHLTATAIRLELSSLFPPAASDLTAA
jgi:hypothetical protein